MEKQRTLDVVIIGAGLAVLTCALALTQYEGISVTIVEKKPRVEEINIGMHLPPNAGHGLRDVGLLRQFEEVGQHINGCFIADYQDRVRLIDRGLYRCRELYRAPWLIIHRTDAMSMLLTKADQRGVIFHYRTKVIDVNFDKTRLRMADGSQMEADVVIAAEGLESQMRSRMFPSHSLLNIRAFSYRAVADCGGRTNQPARGIRSWKTWLGPDAHAISFPLRNGESLDTQVVVASKAFNRSTENGHVTRKLVERLEWDGWSPKLRDLVRDAQVVHRTPLCDMEELRHLSEGHIVLIGDAAHPCLPYLFQTDALAIEDGVVLGTLLGSFMQEMPSRMPYSHLLRLIPQILRAYEVLQLDRAAEIVEKSRETGKWLHYKPGDDQERRDAEFVNYQGLDRTISACPLIDSELHSRLFDRDPAVVAYEHFQSMKRRGLYETNSRR
ncbi:Fc.00g044210.m01.CDS01 [Cosmosporella sp. VM-42]